MLVVVLPARKTGSHSCCCSLLLELKLDAEHRGRPIQTGCSLPSRSHTAPELAQRRS